MRANDPGLELGFRRRRNSARGPAITARSRSVPVGSFVAASRSMRPPCGSGVAAVTCAAANAREFTQPECPSADMKNAGRSGTAASSCWRVGSRIGKHAELPAAAGHPHGARIVARARAICVNDGLGRLVARRDRRSQDRGRRRRCARASRESRAAPCRRRSRSCASRRRRIARRLRHRRRRRCDRREPRRRSPSGLLASAVKTAPPRSTRSAGCAAGGVWPLCRERETDRDDTAPRGPGDAMLAPRGRFDAIVFVGVSRSEAGWRGRASR